MASVFMVALWCAAATAASAIRYNDYSVARMPLYGGADYDARDAPAPEDYRGHSHDAPAALDYKYEEELAGALAGKTAHPLRKEEKTDVEESDTWQRPHKKHKKSSRAIVDHTADVLDKFDPEDDFPKAKSGSRKKQLLRLKSGKFARSDDEAHGYPINHSRDMNDDDFVENEESEVRDEFRNDNRNSNFDDRNRYSHRERGARRKPRDKFVKRKSERDELEIAQSDVERWMLAREGMGRAPEPLSDLQQEEQSRRRRPTVPLGDSAGSLREHEDSTDERNKDRKMKNFDEYSDYYDMKRVNNIKNKLPTLLRRTTVREEITMKTASRSLHEMFANRRVFLPPAPATRTTVSTLSTTVSTTTPTTTASTTTTAKVTTILQNTTRNSSELSLAEKSRLSILKKALRKESLKSGPSSTKPPVLLLVTKKLPTVVMVEPPSSEPFMRAREVFADSPARLERVKRLMRHKLVANAKNIHDLTDNWDDQVCDYIDMSLLDNVADSANRLRNTILVMLNFVVVIILVR